MKDTHSHNHYPEEKWLQSITALLPCFALWWRYDLLCLRQVKCAGKRSLRPPSSMSVSVILRSLFWLRSQQRYLPWQRSINQSAELAKSHRSGSLAAWTDEVRWRQETGLRTRWHFTRQLCPILSEFMWSTDSDIFSLGSHSHVGINQIQIKYCQLALI